MVQVHYIDVIRLGVGITHMIMTWKISKMGGKPGVRAEWVPMPLVEEPGPSTFLPRKPPAPALDALHASPTELPPSSPPPKSPPDVDMSQDGPSPAL